MIGSIYVGLAGMTAYARGLTVIGNNVANLNTPGFKGIDPQFTNLVYRGEGGAVSGTGGARHGGAGVAVSSERTSFRQGDLTDAGNPLDAAIDGNGFFILEQDGRTVYTRVGQFEFDDDGQLVRRGGGERVMVASDAVTGASFGIEGFRTLDPAATTEVELSGSLSRTGSGTHVVSGIKVRDSAGGEHVLSANFVRDAENPLSWTLEIRTEDEEVLGSATLEFDENGTPKSDYEVGISVQPEDLPEFDVAVKLGAAGTFAGVTSVPDSAQSLVQVRDSDGAAIGHLSRIEFTDQGEIRLEYSNGEQLTPAKLLLARFVSPVDLRDIGNGLFVWEGTKAPVLGFPSTSGIGRVMGGRLELSNVDLTDQFAQLIIVQRGYQASSQLTSVANELIQLLLSMGDRG